MGGEKYQNVVIMRHGDRLDNFEPLWVTKSARPWDPPLTDDGLLRALTAGRKLRASLPYPIHRVFVSPFLRCVQTASQVVSALCECDLPNVKVGIEYGLCEMLNEMAIKAACVPPDGNFQFDVSELQSLFPAGTVDLSVEPIFKEMPPFGEPVNVARIRYEHVIKALADKYPTENLLLVTHGEGVGVSVVAFMKDVVVFEVDYCAYSQLRRPTLFHQDQLSAAGNFEVLPSLGQNGIKYANNNGAIDM